MAQTKQQIRDLLASANTGPRHRFGQNFMIDQNLVRLIAAAGEIKAGETVVEVGPGTGTLTEELLASPADRVVAVELDRDLAKLLRERFADNPRFTLIEGDALAGKHGINADLLRLIFPANESPAAPPRDSSADAVASAVPRAAVKLVANLPYNIASPLVIELLIAGVSVLAFTVQKEVADRLRAPGGHDAYGPLSVTAQMLADVEVLRTLPPQAFWPPPKIDSALVRMTRRDRLGTRASEFSRFVQQVFAARRKTLRKALSQLDLPADDLLASQQIDPKLRPEELTPEQVWGLFEKARPVA